MKQGIAAGWLAGLLLLTGCGNAVFPYAREMGDMALLRTMGVDAGEAGQQFQVTVSTGRRAAGLQGENLPPLILSAQAGSLSAACLSIQGLSDSYVFYGYVDQLLVGEDAALTGIEPVLDYFSRDAELSLGAQLWLVRGDTARTAIESGEEAGVEGRLSTLQTDSEIGTAEITRTAGEGFSDLLERGCTYLPALSVVSGEEGGTALLEAGYGVLRQGKLVGYLDGESAEGLELLAGHAAEDILEVELPSGAVAVRITGVSVKCEPVFQGAELSELRLLCWLTAELAEFRGALREEDLGLLRSELERRERLRIQKVMDQLRSWQTDCINLGGLVGRTNPGRWETLEREWDRLFVSVPLDISVDVSVTRTSGGLAGSGT